MYGFLALAVVAAAVAAGASRLLPAGRPGAGDRPMLVH
jgi:hypothetical protein